MRNLFTRLFARRPAARPIKRTILGLESLEGRVVPSASPLHVKPELLYEVTVHNSHSSSVVEKKIAKKNTLTVKNLSPGNYASHSPAVEREPRIVGHHAPSHPLIRLT